MSGTGGCEAACRRTRGMGLDTENLFVRSAASDAGENAPDDALPRELGTMEPL